MDDMTAEEKRVVDELRRRTIHDVTPRMMEDISLFYRFAKARDFNLVEAETMLKKHIAWRKEYKMDTILTDYKPPEVLAKYCATTFIGFAKDGSIIRHSDCGRADAKGLFSLAKKSEVAKFMFCYVEKDRDLWIKNGKYSGKPLYTAIYDFEDSTYANVASFKTVQYLPFILKLFVDNYPETIGRAFVINAPVYITWVYALAKQVLPKNVLEKFVIYGTDGWREDLLKIVDDPGELPAFLGGTKTDPDGNPLCETFVNRGRPIPKRYYTNKGSKKLALSPDAENLTVKPFSKEEITLNVKEENSYLKWELEIKNRDIDFSLLFRGESSEDLEPIDIIPVQRLDANDEPHEGSLRCENTGKYSFVFDNTYSWLHTKEVYFRAEIKSPKNDDINCFQRH